MLKGEPGDKGVQGDAGDKGKRIDGDPGAPGKPGWDGKSKPGDQGKCCIAPEPETPPGKGILSFPVLNKKTRINYCKIF